jgi:hypothetical protein
MFKDLDSTKLLVLVSHAPARLWNAVKLIRRLITNSPE